MPIDWLNLIAAATAGLFGGLHCALMCGGIATGLAASAYTRSLSGRNDRDEKSTARGQVSGGSPAHSTAMGQESAEIMGRADGFAARSASAAQALSPALRTALLTNAGRLLGYSVAGALVGAFGAGLLQLWRAPLFALGLRMLVGVVLLLVALRLFATNDRLGFLNRPGLALWRRLAPLHRHLLPANTPARQLAAGMLWGWLPCGLSASLLAAAWLSADPLQGALIMATFGLGTSAVMLPLTWSGAHARAALGNPALRRSGALLIALTGLLTLTAPWLAKVPALHRLLAVFGCSTLG